MRNGDTSLPEMGILRRWRRDVSRAYTSFAMSYDGLLSTPSQLRCGRMCEVFTTLENITADDKDRTRVIIDWIRLQSKDTVSMKLSCGSTRISQLSLHLGS